MKKSLCFAAFWAGAMLACTGVAAAQEEPPPPDQPPAHPHTVVAGESLSKIARADLGTSDRWVEIFALNRDILASPDEIEVGQVLDVPSAPMAVPPDLMASLTAGGASAPRRQSVRTVRQAGPRPQAAQSNAGGDGNLAAVRACESGGNYAAVSSNSRYRGAYQFDRQTWQSVGGSGDPAAATPAEQDARASQLRSQRGSNPWPVCG